MLGKLLKYEFKATARLFLLAYAVLIVLAGVNAAGVAIGPDSGIGLLVSGVTMVLYVIAACAVFVLTLVIIVVRFYRLLGDEGYLWFTLPVTPARHILGKLVPAVVWLIATTVVTLASVGLVTLRTGWYKRVRGVWHTAESLGYDPKALLAIGLAFVLIALLLQIMMMYAAMAIGPSLIKSSRLGGSVLAYVILYCVLQVVSLAVVGLVALALKDALGVTVGAGVNVVFSSDVSPAVVNHAAAVCGASFGTEYLALAVAAFWTARHFMTKKLNLS